MADDFIISSHALERFEERFPELWTNRRKVGKLIHGETMDALEAGRSSYFPPPELSNKDPEIDKWRKEKGLIVWTPMKSRGYVLLLKEEGTVVATVLKKQTPARTRGGLYGTNPIRETG